VVGERQVEVIEEPAPPTTEQQRPTVSGTVGAEPPTPDAPADEVNSVVPSVPDAAARTAVPAADPARPSAPVASQALVTPTASDGDDAPYGAGSARSLPDGSPPWPSYPIKGNASSMLFHSPDSPYYRRTKAEVWFRTAADARAAGFIESTPRKRATR